MEEDHKTPATSKDVIETIGPQIMNQQAVEWCFIYTTPTNPRSNSLIAQRRGETSRALRLRSHPTSSKQGLPPPSD